MEGAPSGFYARTVLPFDIVRTMQEQNPSAAKESGCISDSDRSMIKANIQVLERHKFP